MCPRGRQIIRSFEFIFIFFVKPSVNKMVQGVSAVFKFQKGIKEDITKFI